MLPLRPLPTLPYLHTLGVHAKKALVTVENALTRSSWVRVLLSGWELPSTELLSEMGLELTLKTGVVHSGRTAFETNERQRERERDREKQRVIEAVRARETERERQKGERQKRERHTETEKAREK